MTQNSGIARLHLYLRRSCRAAAILGGLIIASLAVMTVVSIFGRWLSGIPLIANTPLLDWVGPVDGSYELVEIGTAMAIFLFLPYCHLRGGHVAVELLVMHAPKIIQRLLALGAETLFLIVAALMTWRLYHGLLDKQRYHETSMLLGIPLWWGYAVGVLGLFLLTLVCLYRTVSLTRKSSLLEAPLEGDAP